MDRSHDLVECDLKIPHSLAGCVIHRVRYGCRSAADTDLPQNCAPKPYIVYAVTFPLSPDSVPCGEPLLGPPRSMPGWNEDMPIHVGRDRVATSRLLDK